MQADDPARAALAENAACGLPVLPRRDYYKPQEKADRHDPP